MNNDMSPQEAIQRLKDIKDILVDNYNAVFDGARITKDGSFPAIDVAIAALQAQVPRVLSETELRKMQQELSTSKATFPVWYESKHVSRFNWCELMYKTSGLADYEVLWRCWSARPTAEQMAATPWKEPDNE